VGHNGAGKSTLLGIVARTVYPTYGEVRVTGRVCPLLALGAGFHPDLTGRENIRLNASLLGVTEEDIDQRFDEVVEFSELKPFLDMPLQSYSSGMWVRLGFAVAVFAEPDVFLVDEVLAVGDKDFQQKCLDRMLELRESRTTFLVVSHNPDHIRLLCDRVVWIEHGVVRADGRVDEILPAYQEAKA
jgi:ABC-type polysaccharide/polyol phosphate transport system ATPase subunit